MGPTLGLFLFPSEPYLLKQVASLKGMNQLNPPFSRTHRPLLVARIAFLTALVAGIVFVAARGNFTSRASDNAAIPTAPRDSGQKTSPYRAFFSALPFTPTPVCTTDPIVINNSDSGAGSLRQAIIDACDASTITFNMAMVVSPISLTTAELSINKNLTITGPGSSVLTIQRSAAGGTPNFRIFTINPGKTVTVSGMTVTNGGTADGVPGGGFAPGYGGQGDNGGGILNNGALTLTGLVVTGNRTGNGGAGTTGTGGFGGYGGGIYSSGTLTMTNVTVSNNITGNGSVGDGGGEGGKGGGIFTFFASVRLTKCIISGNLTGRGADGTGASLIGASGGYGGGLFIEHGTIEMTAVVVSDNTTGSADVNPGHYSDGGAGGGIISNSGDVTLINSTLSGNRTGDGAGPSGRGGGGGGIVNAFGPFKMLNSTISGNITGNGAGGGGIAGGFSNTGTAVLTNTTISGNTASGTSERGGGISNAGNSLTLASCTIAGNSAFNGAGIYAFDSYPPPNAKNTIIANNGGASNGDASGALNSQGHNLVSKSDGSTGFTDGVNGDQVGTLASPLNALLGPLANNGGPTFTHALLAGSPALDAAADAPLTTLNGGIDSSATSINVTDASTIPANAGFTILIDTEQMAVTGKTSNTLTVIRGTNGTSADSHSNGANVLAAFDQRGTGFLRRLDSADADTTATVDIGAFEAQASVEDITDKSIAEDTALSFGFNVGDANAITNVTASSGNTTLVPNAPANISLTGSGSTRTLNITPAANQSGASTITVTVTSGSETMSDTFVLTVTAAADTPSVTNATTNEDTQTTSGLVISRNAADGAEVTNFKITGITNGTLFKNNGTTQINNGDFITFAEGNAGLKFTPAPDLFSPTPFSFNVQGATDGSGSGLSPVATGTITVNPVADTPSVTPATTTINTQTTSSLVISRNAVDSAEVTHFKITNITNGTLFKNDGMTEINNNTFITFAEGNLGLKFTPSHNLVTPSSTFTFQVQGATSSGGAGLSSAATATITVNCGGASDVVTNTNDSGLGSLRNAIANACPGGTITFAPALTSGGPATITLTSAELLIDKNLTIQGPGANVLTISGNNNSRIFNIPSINTITITDLTISNGRVVGTSGGTNGGPGRGGGIFNQNGILTLLNVILSNNSATGGNGTINGGVGRGGGIYSEATLIVFNSTLSQNSATGGNGSNDLGNSGDGGGIFNFDTGTVNITGSTITQNSATGGTGPGTLSHSAGGGAGSGGGIVNQSGTLTITNSLIGNNIANGGVRSGFGAGGGILNSGTLNMTKSVVSGNSVTGGVGVANIGGFCAGGGIENGKTMTITDSSISGNAATGGNGSLGGGSGQGGGVYNNGDFLTITNGTLSHNSATGGNSTGTGDGGFGMGGGLNSDQNCTVTVTNSTLSQNSARGGNGNNGNAGPGRGGGILLFGVLTITNLTISGNSASDGSGNPGNDGNRGGGIYSFGGSTINVRNTIIAGNTTDVTGADIFGPFNSLGHNLIGKGDGGTGFTNGNSGDQVGTVTAPLNPLLAALSNNGGSTQTQALLPGSSAIDAGDNCVAQITNCNDANIPQLTTDQRGVGFDRIINTTVDIGAVEVNYSITATAGTPQSAIIVSNFATQLQATVKESGVNQIGVTVTFTAPASGASGTFPGNVTTANATTDASGVATAPVFTANGSAGGPYSVVASLAGGSPAASFSLTNTKTPTATTVLSSVNPSDLGQNVTFTATVTGGTGAPTGVVQFTDGASNLGSPVSCVASGVNTCTAQVSTSILTTGTHTISATYSGDSTFLGSSGTLSAGQVVTSQPALLLILDESGPDANQAAAFDSFLFVRDPFHVQSVANWLDLGPDRNTRVIIFAGNLQLNQGETASAVVVNLVDANNQIFDVAAEDVRVVPNFGFAQITFRLPDNLAPGACMVTVKAHGQISNTGTIRIVP
jgi:hypothetical protein